MIESDVAAQFEDVTVATPSGGDSSSLSILVEGEHPVHTFRIGLIVISIACDIFISGLTFHFERGRNILISGPAG